MKTDSFHGVEGAPCGRVSLYGWPAVELRFVSCPWKHSTMPLFKHFTVRHPKPKKNLAFLKAPGFELPHLIVFLVHTLSGDLSGHDPSAVKPWLRYVYLVYKGWQMLSSNFHFLGICGPYQRTVGGMPRSDTKYRHF